MRSVRLRTANLLVAVLGLLASGCSGGDAKPTTLPSLSATPSVTASPATVPTAAKAQTPQGADAFVRFFFKQLNVAFSSSEPSIIGAYSNGECTTCDTYEKAVAAARNDGHFLRGDSFVVSEVAAAPLQSLGTLVEVFGAIPARQLVDGNGKFLQTLTADGDFHFTVAVKRTSDGWLVSGIRLGST